MAQMKEQIKTPEKELSDKEIAKLSDAEFKTLVIRMLTGGWVWLQNGGKSEGCAKWNKENIQGTNSEGKETGTQMNDLEQKEEIDIQPEQNKEDSKKKKRGKA